MSASIRRSPTIAPNTPREALFLFQAAFNEARLEDLVALYEPDAVHAAGRTGPVAGRDAIGGIFMPFISRGVMITMQPAHIVETRHGLAMAIAAWNSAGTNPDGTPVRYFGTCHIVLRRQPDGTWRYLIHDPGFGNTRDAG